MPAAVSVAGLDRTEQNMNRHLDRQGVMADRIHHASAEELLIHVVLHHAGTHKLIEAELARRAKGDVPKMSHALRPQPQYKYSQAA